MFRNIILGVVLACACISTSYAAFSGGSRSFSSPTFRSTPSFSPSKSFASPGYKPSPSIAPAAKPNPTFKSGTYNPAPSVSKTGGGWFGGGSSNTVVHNHYYGSPSYGHPYYGGGGFFGGYGGFGNSPWFWLWLMDRPQQVVQQQPVVVAGGAPGASGSFEVTQVVQPPSFAAKVFNALLGLLMIGGVIALIVWLIHKARS